MAIAISPELLSASERNGYRLRRNRQLPAALARFLTSRGVECQHVLDIGLSDATDAVIWEYAGRNHFVVISKDDDFLYLANTRLKKARSIWIRLGNCRTSVLLDAIAAVWPRIEAGLKAGDRIIEVR